MWTLAVEEQFYLIWPFIILIVPQRWLLPLLICVITTGPLFRFFGFLNEMDGIALYTLPFASLDSLAFGATLAYLYFYKSRIIDRFETKKVAVFGVSLVLVLILINTPFSSQILSYAVHDFILSIVFVLFVLGAVKGYSNIFGRFLLRMKYVPTVPINP